MISKGELFVQALERYATTFREHQAAILTDTELDGAGRLRAVLEAIIEEEHTVAGREHGAGCMVVHS